MSSNVLYILRHGMTDYNIPGMLRDKAPDIPLNEVGRQQARDTAQEFEDKSIVIYTSPIERSKETAKIIAEIVKAPLFVDPDLTTWDYGNLDLETELIPFQRNPDRPPPDGEPFRIFVERFKKCLCKHWLSKDIELLITHSRNLYLLEYWVEDLPEVRVSGIAPGTLMKLKTKLKD